MTVDSLISQFKKLDQVQKERFMAATNLQEDVDQLSPEWEAEIDRRISEYRKGKANLIDGLVVEKDLIEKYDLNVSTKSTS